MDAETTLLYGLFQRLPIVVGLNVAVALGTVLVFAGQHSNGDARRLVPVHAAHPGAAPLDLAGAAARRHGAASPEWARHFTLGAAATGLAWGLAGVIFYAPDSWTSQVFLPFIMAGMIGGSVTALTGHMPAFAAFSICTLVPYAAAPRRRGRWSRISSWRRWWCCIFSAWACSPGR